MLSVIKGAFTFGAGRSNPESSNRLFISLLMPLLVWLKFGLDDGFPQAPVGMRLSEGCIVVNGGKSVDCRGTGGFGCEECRE